MKAWNRALTNEGGVPTKGSDVGYQSSDTNEKMAQQLDR